MKWKKDFHKIDGLLNFREKRKKSSFLNWNSLERRYISDGLAITKNE